jgi:hypothetical protein
MGKGRDKRRRKVKGAKELDQLMFDLVARATLSGSDPPALGEPDAPVNAPLKPKPNLRSGAITLPEPELEDTLSTLSVVKSPILPK